MIHGVLADLACLVVVGKVDQDFVSAAADIAVIERAHHIELPGGRAVQLRGTGHQRDVIAHLPPVLLRELLGHQSSDAGVAQGGIVFGRNGKGERRQPVALRTHRDDTHLLIGLLIRAAGKLHGHDHLHTRYRPDRLEQPQRQGREDEVRAGVHDQQIAQQSAIAGERQTRDTQVLRGALVASRKIRHCQRVGAV